MVKRLLRPDAVIFIYVNKSYVTSPTLVVAVGNPEGASCVVRRSLLTEPDNTIVDLYCAALQEATGYPVHDARTAKQKGCKI